MMNRIVAALGMLMAIPAALTAHAQGFYLAPEAGYAKCNYHAVKASAAGVESSKGYRLGAIALYDFGNGPYIKTGLSYTHLTDGNISRVADAQRLPYVNSMELRRLEFLTLPLTGGVEVKFGAHWAVGVEAGGYVAAGLGSGSVYFHTAGNEGNGGEIFGDSSFTVRTDDATNRVPVTVKGSSRMDAGLLFGGHVRWKAVALQANYQLGLKKTVFDIASPRTYTLTASYCFHL